MQHKIYPYATCMKFEDTSNLIFKGKEAHVYRQLTYRKMSGRASLSATNVWTLTEAAILNVRK